MEAGDRTSALAAVEAALAIDPEFLAAQSLRDRIIASRDVPLRPAPATTTVGSGPGGRRPLVSAEGYAKFEERARRRRVDKRIEAARSAIERKKLREAASALDEVIELDPNMPELAVLTAAFDELRRSTVRADRGPWVAAAVVFGTMVLAASWIEESRVLQSRAVTAVAPLVASAAPDPIVLEPNDANAEPTGTVGEQFADTDVPFTPVAPPARPIPANSAAGRSVAVTHEPALPPPPPSPQPRRGPAQLAAPPSQPAPISAAPIQDISAAPLPQRPAPAVARNTLDPAATMPPVVPATPVPTSNADELQVKQVLQRYRVAYEGLDAQSAQAVWPAVNQVALARAFDGLESQRLTFEACSVELQGSSHAVATCRGTARYVPKVGSRQPRIEPRIWSFALRKIGADWKIDNARAER
jgi:hypothetical protein